MAPALGGAPPGLVMRAEWGGCSCWSIPALGWEALTCEAWLRVRTPVLRDYLPHRSYSSQGGLRVLRRGCVTALKPNRMVALTSLGAGRLGYASAQLHDTAQQLADGLAAMGRLGDAAAVTAAYLGDVDGAVALLAAAREWREALRVAYASGRGDLVETNLAPAAAVSSEKIGVPGYCCCVDK